MKALLYSAPRAAQIVEVETPRASGRTSVAQTLVSNVSAGTEMGFYRGTAPQMNTKIEAHCLFNNHPNALTYPMRSCDPGIWWMGYSAIGKVVECGPEEKNLKVGDLVYQQTGHKGTMASDGFFRLPPGTNPDHASFLALINIAYNGMLDARVKLLDEVVIFGMGVLGQLLLQMCKLSGARVTAVDYVDSRLRLAKEQGADVIFNPSKDGDIGTAVQAATGGRGADVVIEVSGNVNALPHAIRSVGPDGKVIVLSFYQGGSEPVELGKEFHHKRITLRSSQIGGINPEMATHYNADRRMEDSIKLLSLLHIEPLISHRVAFEELPGALSMIDKDPSACNGVLVHY